MIEDDTLHACLLREKGEKVVWESVGGDTLSATSNAVKKNKKRKPNKKRQKQRKLLNFKKKNRLN